MMIQNSKNEAILSSFIRLLRRHKDVDADWVTQITKDYLNRKEGRPIKDINLLSSLERDWYEGLRERNDPPYYLYGDDRYIPDALSCFFIYSKKYIKAISEAESYRDLRTYQAIQSVRSIADLGAGFGLTTVQIKQNFPEAEVFATNLPETLQYEIMTELGERYSFAVRPSLRDIGKVDLIFASEYFEHFYEPVSHLREVLREGRPKYIFFANTFTSDAVGHFDSYLVDGSIIHGSKMGRVFGEALRQSGYRKENTNLWNNRPSLYVKS